MQALTPVMNKKNNDFIIFPNAQQHLLVLLSGDAASHLLLNNFHVIIRQSIVNFEFFEFFAGCLKDF